MLLRVWPKTALSVFPVLFSVGLCGKSRNPAHQASGERAVTPCPEVPTTALFYAGHLFNFGMPSADQQFAEQGMPGRSLPGQLLDVEGEPGCSAPLLFWGPRE